MDLVAMKRQSFSSTVSILVTNNTEEFLDMRKDWVKGGEAINRPVSLIRTRVKFELLSLDRILGLIARLSKRQLISKALFFKFNRMNKCLQVDISPGKQEAFLVSRNHRGNHGTIAYTLGRSDMMLLIMWTSGMNCDHYANVLAVGVTMAKNTDKFR